MVPSIDDVWERLRQLQDEGFKTKLGREFSFTISGAVLRPKGKNRNIPKSHFRQVLPKLPLDGPAKIEKEIDEKVQGTSYVWAILHDPRVRQNDW